MSQVVVDAAFIAQCLIPGPQSANALAVLERLVDEAVTLTAPGLIDAEVAATLHRQVYQRGLLPEEASAAWEAYLQLAIEHDTAPGSYADAMALAQRLQRAALYDCLYAAVAERRQCWYWTGNRRFFVVAQVRLPNLRWLGDYPV